MARLKAASAGTAFTAQLSDHKMRNATEPTRNISPAFHVCNLVLLCFPLVTNIFALAILFAPKIRKSFGFFGIHLIVLTITEILFCVVLAVASVLQLYLSPGGNLFNLIQVIGTIVLWLLLGVSNWTVALLCVNQCKSDSSGSIRNWICFLGVLIAFVIITILLSVFIILSYIFLMLGLVIFSIFLPFLTIAILSCCLCHKVRMNNPRRSMATKKVALSLAIVFLISNLVLIVLFLISFILGFIFVAYTFIFTGLTTICTAFCLIFAFCVASKKFREEAMRCLTCKEAASTPQNTSEEVPMTAHS